MLQIDIVSTFSSVVCTKHRPFYKVSFDHHFIVKNSKKHFALDVVKMFVRIEDQHIRGPSSPHPTEKDDILHKILSYVLFEVMSKVSSLQLYY